MTDGAGDLLGFDGIVSQGVRYDVRFEDGAFADIFGDGSGLTFLGDVTGGLFAANALNDAITGVFDDDPTRTVGCADGVGACDYHTPISGVDAPTSSIETFATVNRAAGGGGDFVQGLSSFPDINTATDPQALGTVWANWSASPVPEPAAGLVLLVALVSLPAVRWSFDRQARAV